MLEVRAIRCRLLSATALASVLSVAGAQAAGLPSHGHFVSGQGSINKASQSLTVKQSSTTGIINWNSFSVGGKNSVTFDNGSGATLNRVTGGNLSRIAGSLHATGSLFLMNSSGVIVSGTGRVVTGGNFAATSGNLDDSAFDNGDRRFKTGSGAVINRGTITAGGSAMLAGRDVRDQGTIHASQVDLDAHRKLLIDGDVAARNADGTGGTIIATARKIDVAGHANLSASGTKGGTVLIGGDVHGGAIAADDFVKQSVRTAQTTTVAAGARISADASRTAGGNIVIWSDGHTSFAGQISAKGQTKGGFSEVSSHDLLGFTGNVDLAAAHGRSGTLLLDPENITIEDGSSSGVSISGGSSKTVTPGADDSILAVSKLESLLASANVEVTTGSSGSQAGDITVLAPVTWSSSHKLTLDAYHSIYIDAPITITGAGRLTLTTDDGGSGGDYYFDGGNIAFTDVVSGTTQGALIVNGTTFTLVNSISQLAAAVTNDAAGDYALADSYNASTDGTYAASPVSTTFTGTLEGLGNAISHLKITDATASDTVGLFSAIGSGGVVRDIALEAVNVKAADGSTVGALAGTNAGTISGSSVSGSVYAGADTSVVGGLVGSNSGMMTSDSASASVTIGDTSIAEGDTSNVGGLVGTNSGTVSYSFASGAVADVTAAHTGSGSDADAYLGGLIGYSSGTVSYSYATGTVTGVDTDYVGGLIGDLGDGTVSHSYATGHVVSADGKAGGFAGNADGTLSYDYATGAVAGGGEVGGLAGNNEGTISQSYATGAVTGTESDADVGGLIGYQPDGSLSTSYASGKVTDKYADGDVGGLIGNTDGGSVETSFATGAVSAGAGSDVGGFIGYNENNSITQSYATGAVTGGSDASVGGFVGENDSGGTIDESYSLGKATGGSGATVGGFAGNNENTNGISSMVGNYYNSTANGSGGLGADSDTGGSDVHGLSLSAMRTAASFSEWTDFGTTGGDPGWVIVDRDGSFNNENGATGGTTPILLAEYSTTITDTHQLQLIALDTTASYTLANTIDASGTNGGDVWGSQGFVPISGLSGSLDGQGFTVSHLYIKDASSSEVGLFGSVTGTISNIGVVDETVTGSHDTLVGGLAGQILSDATITNSYTTGKVTGGTASEVGGLVGLNYGTIEDSYSAANVTVGATGDFLSDGGGLVGDNELTIDRSFATGTVTGGNESVIGGLAGFSYGSEMQTYATGHVISNGADAAGGLVGDLTAGTIDQSYSLGQVTGTANALGGFLGMGSSVKNSYWDTQTSGVSQATGSGSLTGLTGVTTAKLQSALPKGFSSSAWSIVAGESFPYLTWQFDGTPEVVSGKAYSSYGGNGASGVTINLLDGDSVLVSALTGGAVTTYADGSYYYLLAPGSIAAGDNVTAYRSGTGGVAFANNVSGSISDLSLYNHYLNEVTSASKYSTVESDLSDVVSGDTALGTIVGGLTNLAISATGDFKIDSAIDENGDVVLNTGALTLDADVTAGDTLTVDSSGTVAEASSATIDADALTGTSNGAAKFNGTNVINDLDGFSTGGDHDFELTDNRGLTVKGAVNAGTGDLDLTTTGSDYDLNIDSAITGGTVNLVATGKAQESSAGAIAASLLNVTAGTGIELTSSNNNIKKLGKDTTTKGPNKVTL